VARRLKDLVKPRMKLRINLNKKQLIRIYAVAQLVLLLVPALFNWLNGVPLGDGEAGEAISIILILFLMFVLAPIAFLLLVTSLYLFIKEQKRKFVTAVILILLLNMVYAIFLYRWDIYYDI
jgi:membrane-associated HD superfamily phosphohydrolase